MQLMTLNSLLMFDIVFIFFLFLVGVTCLVYYLPPPALASSFRSSSSSLAKQDAEAIAAAAAATSNITAGPTSGTTVTCTGETVRFRRYSVGSLFSANELAVGNHRFHSASGVDDPLLLTAAADCELEEILSLSGGGSPVLVAPGEPCACCAVEQQQLQQQFRYQQPHLVENPHEALATAGVDYVQIEIERIAADPVPPCCYVRAKDADIKECHGPIHDV